jgi:hypothetical protein
MASSVCDRLRDDGRFLSQAHRGVNSQPAPRGQFSTGLDSSCGTGPLRDRLHRWIVANLIVGSGGAQMMKALVSDDPSSRALSRCAHILRRYRVLRDARLLEQPARGRELWLRDRLCAPGGAAALQSGQVSPSPPEVALLISTDRGDGTRPRCRCVPAARDPATGTCPTASRDRARTQSRCGR